MRRLPLLVVAVLSCVVSACRCGDDLSSLDSGFRALPDAVDFGKTLVGTPLSSTVTLESTGRAAASVSVDVTPPFVVEGDSLIVPGAGSVTFGVSFPAASAGNVTGTLTFRSPSGVSEVALTARAVAPTPCEPDAQCRVGRFDLEAEACVFSVADDGADCVPSDLCLENGVCLEGTCLGTPRSCDDGNICTTDACAPDLGCVNTPRACPLPTAQCKVAVCRPDTGCGEEDAADFSRCGTLPFSCAVSELCRGGTCQRFEPTPNGTPCAPATPCQPEGACQAGVCDQDPPTTMVPAFSLPLTAAPKLESAGRARLVESPGGGIVFEQCGGPPPMGMPGDPPDPNVCGLASYTAQGFERFTTWYPADDVERALVAGAGTQVLVTTPDGLEAYASGTGLPSWSVDLTPVAHPMGFDTAVPVWTRERIAIGPRNEAWMALGFETPAAVMGDPATPVPWQALVRVASDGVLTQVGTFEEGGAGGRLALSSAAESFFTTSPEGAGAQLRTLTDATTGEVRLDVRRALTGNARGGGLAVSGANVCIDERQEHFVPLAGGAPSVVREWPSNATAERVDPGSGVLMASNFGHRFLRVCPAATSCAPAAEALVAERQPLSSDGTAPSPATPVRVQLAPGNVGATLEGATLLTEGKLCTLTQRNDGGIVRAALAAHRGADTVFTCELPRTGTLRGSVFSGTNVFVVVEKADGSFVLEAYALTDQQLETRGWPGFDGVGQSRRSRP